MVGIESVFLRSPDKEFWACLGDSSGGVNTYCMESLPQVNFKVKVSNY